VHYIRVGAAALNQTPLDWEHNQLNIETVIAKAREQQIQILCLPELCISGYGCEDMFLAPSTLQQAQRVLLQLIPKTYGLCVAVGLPMRVQNRIYNMICLLVDGEIAGFVAKRFLAANGIHYEPRWFHAWNYQTRSEIKFAGKTYPCGDIFFDCGGIRIGFEICEEAWIPHRPGIDLAKKGVDIILNPSASHFAFDKHSLRERFVLEGARAFGVSYVYANLLGNEAGRVIYDGDSLIASAGQLLAVGKRFSFNEYHIISALVDVDLTRMAQARTSQAGSNLDDLVSIDFDYPLQLPQVVSIPLKSWEYSPNLKEEEFTRAICLGLFDYLRKSRAHGFVLSLSGGADSAAIACLVRLMVELGSLELGLNNFCAKLPGQHSNATTISDVMRDLLTCVYQATKNSSNITKNAASTLAQNLGARYLEFELDNIITAYTQLIEKTTNTRLNWQQHDVVLQNIQARARAPGVWMLANLHQALLLATSNRSEVALGYATMDGDTAGSLSPIAGIDKHFLRQWLQWLEQEGVMHLKPIPSLSLINQQAPTAELRPPEMTQTDEVDLMPYALITVIERAAIYQRQTPYEIFCLLQYEYEHYGDEQLLLWIERFFRLWARNQWKRERYAPSFHVDDLNLDPRSWCRFPILSGQFERELEEMYHKARG
jgi:NAD+ synthase (glutamine-hydrolysing)